MKISVVICEYNPFHNGHEYMLSQMRKNGSTHIAAVMSGNFTQRGDAAVFDKFTRAKAALHGGADLVIELPVEFACSYAERFAFGGVFAANALGCADELAFGSECGNISLLRTAAAAVNDENVLEELSMQLKKGITFAAARENAVQKIFGADISSLLRCPNDILGIEYLKALSLCGSNISPAVIRRTGAGHDSSISENGITSAKNIRQMIYSGDKSFVKYIPDYARKIYQTASDQPPQNGRMKKLENALLYRLRTMSKQEMAVLPEIAEGLENRLYNAARIYTDRESIINAVKSKRYTYARINRILTYTLLGFTAAELPEKPAYIRILGFNERGREILRAAKKNATLPIITRSSSLSEKDSGRKMFDVESLCDDIYAMSGENILPCGKNMTEKMITM